MGLFRPFLVAIGAVVVLGIGFLAFIRVYNGMNSAVPLFPPLREQVCCAAVLFVFCSRRQALGQGTL